LGMGSGSNGGTDTTTTTFASARIDDDDDVDDGGTGDRTSSTSVNIAATPTSRSANRQRWRPRDPSTRRRHLSYRLSDNDLRHPDPGSMESVRQGLMTMHTLFSSSNVETINNNTTNIAEEEEDKNITHNNSSNDNARNTYRFQQPGMYSRSPLDTQRRFFRGQWIDVRDTVNQWLEATIVETVLPEEILSPPAPGQRHRRRGPTTVPANDPAVSASDLSGRRRLLLEACGEEEHEPTLGIELDSNGDPRFFRQRDTNDGVQLLLVHYNGWPHRWDEWIRSDSERIRLFRTRTRHPSNNLRISPTVQSPFSESPSTHFIQNRAIATSYEAAREQDDRHALLPELARIMTVVNDLLSNAAAESFGNITSTGLTTSHSSLPWVTSVSLEPDDNPTIIENCDEDDDSDREDSDECKQPASEDLAAQSNIDKRLKTKVSRASLRRRRQELETLAPLLERFGRILVDSAPQVAALAASLEQADISDNLRRSNPSCVDSSDDNDEERQPSTLGSFLSLLSRDRRRNTSVGSSNAAILGNDSVSLANSNEQTTVASTSNRDDDDDGTDTETVYEVQVDPDYTDFATSVVNTTRGDVRGGSSNGSTNRQTAVGSTSDELAGLLGAYLAAASLGSIVSGSDDDEAENGGATATGATAQGIGRMLRERGVGGNGIDIHIHAVVTAPGGNVGLATLGGTGLGSRNRSTPTSTSARTQEPHMLQEDDDDLGIFAELYSESPDPIDPSSPGMNGLHVEPSRVADLHSHPISQLQQADSTENIQILELPSASPVTVDESNINLHQAAANSPPPTLFSRSSRRSGFVSSGSVNDLSPQAASGLQTTGSSVGTSVGIEQSSPVSTSLQYRVPPSPSGALNTSSNTISSSGRSSRGSVLSRLFHRRNHQD
jgi:hypothetical protein